MKLYLIAGKADVGKNLFANILKKDLEATNHKVCLLRITAPLYHYAEEQFNLSVSEEDKPREFLQYMGIDYIKEKLGLKTFLIDRLTEDIKILDNFFDVGIITDGRLIEEFDELKKRFPKIKIIKLERNNYDTNLTNKEKNHITEKDLEKEYIYDYVVINDTLEKLEKVSKDIVLKEDKDE